MKTTKKIVRRDGVSQRYHVGRSAPISKEQEVKNMIHSIVYHKGYNFTMQHVSKIQSILRDYPNVNFKRGLKGNMGCAYSTALEIICFNYKGYMKIRKFYKIKKGKYAEIMKRE